MERLDGDRSASGDGSAHLISDIGSSAATRSSLELCKINFNLVDPSIEAILFFLDGGSRNFSMVSTT